MVMTKKAKLLWMDLEMTGLDPVKDRILEVSIIATDWKLNEIAKYSAVVFVYPALMKRRMVGKFWDKNAKTRDALMKQNVASGRAVAEIEQEILGFIKKHFKAEIYLAGNSIHQDRKFIDREWPKLSEKLHFRMLDVSAWKIWFENVKKVKLRKLEGHRADDDVVDSIIEFKKYLEYIK